MNEFRNIIIDSRKNIAIGVNYPDAAVSDKRIKIKCLKYSGEGLPFSNHNQATKLNSLYLLNKYLTKIKQLKEEDENKDIQCRIIINNSLWKTITKGTYKTWVKIGCYHSNKKPLSKEELKLWEDFSKLYSELFLEVTFADLNLYKLNNIKYNYVNVIYAKKVINKIESIMKEYEDNELDKLFSNIL